MIFPLRRIKLVFRGINGPFRGLEAVFAGMPAIFAESYVFNRKSLASIYSYHAKMVKMPPQTIKKLPK